MRLGHHLFDCQSIDHCLASLLEGLQWVGQAVTRAQRACTEAPQSFKTDGHKTGAENIKHLHC
jgi:hypothetical protein